MVFDENLRDMLMRGGVSVLRTDTLYGIVARAADKQAVARVFEVKRRDVDKPLIVLVASAQDAWDGQEKLAELSGGERPTSVIIDSPHAPEWLRHSDGTVAYRVPRPPELRALLAETGPLVAPSANPQWLPPARSVVEARAYFGDKIDYYADSGTVPEADSMPSRIVRIAPDGGIVIIRE